jgi:hypothetical protein
MAKRTIDPRRLDEVERRWLHGHPTHTIEMDLAAEWGCTRRAIRKYLGIVRERVAARMAVTDVEAERARVVTLLLNAYRAAETGSGKGPDAKAMVQAAARLGEVFGVMAPKKLEYTGAIDPYDPKALHERLVALVAKARGSADADGAGAAESEGTG